MKSVVLVDTRLFITNLGEMIVEKLKEVHGETGNIKVCIEHLIIPFSIQWIIPKRNAEGKKVKINLGICSKTLKCSYQIPVDRKNRF